MRRSRGKWVDTMNIKNKITEITKSLGWKIVHKSGDRDIEITSDPWTKTHTIKIPTSGEDWRDIEYLHELAHAVLAERHHLLSTAYFARGSDRVDYEALRNSIRSASDWFADDLLMQWVPDEEKSEIREHANYVRAYAGHEQEIIYAGGLFIAQAVHYLGDKVHTIPHRYRPVVDIFLSIDPSKPTVQAKRNLINQLAVLTCRQRVYLTREDGMDVWRIKKEKK